MKFSRDENGERSPARSTAIDLESRMRRVSQVVSTAAVALMLAGLLETLLTASKLAPPDVPVMPLSSIVQLDIHPLGLAAMSTGILLLALLPVLRVLLALGIYASQRALINTIAALIVLVELLISMRAG